MSIAEDRTVIDDPILEAIAAVEIQLRRIEKDVAEMKDMLKNKLPRSD